MWSSAWPSPPPPHLLTRLSSPAVSNLSLAFGRCHCTSHQAFARRGVPASNAKIVSTICITRVPAAPPMQDSCFTGNHGYLSLLDTTMDCETQRFAWTKLGCLQNAFPCVGIHVYPVIASMSNVESQLRHRFHYCDGVGATTHAPPATGTRTARRPPPLNNDRRPCPLSCFVALYSIECYLLGAVNLEDAT